MRALGVNDAIFIQIGLLRHQNTWKTLLTGNSRDEHLVSLREFKSPVGSQLVPVCICFSWISCMPWARYVPCVLCELTFYSLGVELRLKPRLRRALPAKNTKVLQTIKTAKLSKSGWKMQVVKTLLPLWVGAPSFKNAMFLLYDLTPQWAHVPRWKDRLSLKAKSTI